MIKLKIDNKEIIAEEGTTILGLAREAGISIPTLCHKDDVEHYTSCMVCMVKDKALNRYVPSCTALAQNGMDIDTSGEDVIALRKKAVELLLSEHRAECEAPCRVVCPGGYNIPLMNRLLTAGKYDEAFNLTVSEINTPQIICINCQGYCENACRRKKVDTAVSIRNIKLFISQSITGVNKNSPEVPGTDELIKEKRKAAKASKRFASHIGKLEPEEFTHWLKECNEAERYREISNPGSASKEAGSCMHCDCRAADDCRLRDLADDLSMKDPRGKIVNSPIQKKINVQTGLVFENAKCIKCGLCVRICEDSTDEPVLCFINRGFVSIISEPLTQKFEEVLMKKADDCINICPTGALSHFK